MSSSISLHMFSSRVNHICLPGDEIGLVSLSPNFPFPKNEKLISIPSKFRLGHGISVSSDPISPSHSSSFRVFASQSGILRFISPFRFFIESKQKKYLPNVDDVVIGIVVEKNAEFFKLEINAPFLALLPVLAFDGATKRNRPNLQPGALVFCRVTQTGASSRIQNSSTSSSIGGISESEVSCISASGKGKDWMTGESTFGEIGNPSNPEVSSGFVLECNVAFARRLMDSDSIILSSIGKLVPFEIVVGANGRVWVNSTSFEKTILIGNAILNSEFIGDDRQKIEAMVHQMLQRVIDK